MIFLQQSDRTHMMQVLEYQMIFTAPAFVGDAEQSGRWRTPPIKALLRQWWRMGYAEERHFPATIDAMREKEGHLFGNAWLTNGAKNDHTKSAVRIRLDRWSAGTLRQAQWAPLDKVPHPEVSHKASADLYMGYGPVTLPRGGSQPQLKANAAIQVGEAATLSLAVPEADAPDIAHALWLMDRYGTLGGRSRNGWGSFALIPVATRTLPVRDKPVLRPWKDCLSTDWPHAIGQDAQGPLIWETPAFADWKGLMVHLAKLKIELRTHFVFNSGKNAERPEARHWLAYPVTHHNVKSWGGNARLPNMLRFKIRTTADGKVVGVIYLVPHLPPAGFHPERPIIERVWFEVLTFLDQPNHSLHRISA
jgi:CRISPR-associated protein Cmr1